MIVFKDEMIYKKAAAWHDHGHENNPTVPRWEDTRSSSGFNFRMSELQGAVGIAQLRKLKKIISLQRKSRDIIWSAISSIPGITPRETEANVCDSADALVFLVPNSEVALRCREQLLKINISTKILPEAYTWHFAGTWSHIKQLSSSHHDCLQDAFPKSQSILSRAVSLPVSIVSPTSAKVDEIKNALLLALSYGEN